MRKIGNLLLGAILGGVLGSSIALLLAPSSGEEIRRDINQYFEHLQDEVSRAADEKRAELEAELQSLKSGKKGVTPE